MRYIYMKDYNPNRINMSFTEGYALGVIAMNPKSESAERIKSRLNGVVSDIADVLIHPENSNNYSPSTRKAAIDLENWVQETRANNNAKKNKFERL